MPDIGVIRAALADQLQDRLCGTADPAIEQLTVYAYFETNPTPPAVDVYYGDPSTTIIAYGPERELNFLVRARVTTADHIGGQEILDQLLDWESDTSIEQALNYDRTLGGQVEDVVVREASGLGIFPAVGVELSAGSLMGVIWPVTVIR